MNPALDRIEDKLPAIPRRIFRLNRTIADTTYQMVSRSTCALYNAAADVAKTANTGAKTVTGQARAATSRVASDATRGVREVTGQVRAQTDRTLTKAEAVATDLVDDSIDEVEDVVAPNAEWTREALYDLAQVREIEGRSSMSKAELIRALNADR